MKKCVLCRHARRKMKDHVYCMLMGIIIREDYERCDNFYGRVIAVKSGATASAGTGGGSSSG